MKSDLQFLQISRPRARKRGERAPEKSVILTLLNRQWTQGNGEKISSRLKEDRVDPPRRLPGVRAPGRKKNLQEKEKNSHLHLAVKRNKQKPAQEGHFTKGGKKCPPSCSRQWETGNPEGQERVRILTPQRRMGQNSRNEGIVLPTVEKKKNFKGKNPPKWNWASSYAEQSKKDGNSAPRREKSQSYKTVNPLLSRFLKKKGLGLYPHLFSSKKRKTRGAHHLSHKKKRTKEIKCAAPLQKKKKKPPAFS